jgi:Lon protease-like protein
VLQARLALAMQLSYNLGNKGAYRKRPVTNIQELPLFPLNSVLFPGMPLYLHIFEPRYKLMIAECLEESRPFGVVLIRKGHEVGSPVETYEIGTTAHITHVKHLEGGEMNIAALGHRRFLVKSVSHAKPYLTGHVTDYPLSNPHDAASKAIARQLAPMVHKYLDVFANLGNLDLKLEKLPEDPVTLAFLTAVVLNVPAKDKQTLLGIPDLVALLRAERRMIAREARFLKHLIENGPRWRDDSQLFSPN